MLTQEIILAKLKCIGGEKTNSLPTMLMNTREAKAIESGSTKTYSHESTLFDVNAA